jgi:hypothetical protein
MSVHSQLALEKNIDRNPCAEHKDDPFNGNPQAYVNAVKQSQNAILRIK